MRFAYPLVLLVFCLFVGNLWLSTTVGADPTAEAQAFLKDVRQCDLIDAVKQFGSNVCHCPAKGGWVSYLIYQSGQEHNLAFMLGHPFEAGAPNATPVNNKREALLPWQVPEDFLVDFPIKFDAQSYEPYFLPLKMAYGKDMTQAEFAEFLKDPDKDSWKGLTLRLRSGVEAGAIKPPTIQVPEGMQTDFKSYKKVQDALAYSKEAAEKSPGKQADSVGVGSSGGTGKGTGKGSSNSGSNDSDTELSAEYIKKNLGGDMADYIIPQDAGKVIGTDGKALSDKEVEALLPRLKNMTLRLHVVRRDKIQNWTIYHFALEDPVLIMPNGMELTLHHHQRPKAGAS